MICKDPTDGGPLCGAVCRREAATRLGALTAIRHRLPHAQRNTRLRAGVDEEIAMLHAALRRDG